MSIDCQTPSSLGLQLTTSALPKRSSFLFPKSGQRGAPPMSYCPQNFELTRSNRKHGRSSSFSGFVSRMLPSNRDEKEYTLSVEQNLDVGQASSNNTPGIHEQIKLRKEIRDGGEARKTKRWSTSKFAAVVYGQGELDNSEGALLLGPRDSGNPELLGPDLLQFRINEMEKKGGSWRTIFDGRKSRSDMIQRKPVNKREYVGRQGILKVKKEVASETVIGVLRPAATSLPALAPLAGFSEEKQITRAQQVFDNKKAFREQRKCLRESGDFIGVTGANPRTGYYDSDNTTSSQPSQVSDGTKRKLDQQAHETAEQKEKYDEARAKLKAELGKIQTLRDNNRRVKAEQRQKASRQRQRARGKWKLSEHGWSSVAEPELSPIEQSLASSPKGELAPGDRLFPMPCAADPAPYMTTAVTAPQEYGNRAVLSPVAHDRVDQSNGGSPSPKIIRKPVGTPLRRQLNKSSGTIIHTDIFRKQSPPAILSHVHPQSENGRVHGPEPATDLLATDSHDLHAEQIRPFLETPAQQSEPGDLLERRATAISYQSISMKPVLIHQPRVQSQKALVLEARMSSINSLDRLPPVMLKGQVAARIPSNNLAPKEAFLLHTPSIPTRMESDLPATFINTSTITTTGFVPLPGRLMQFIGLVEGEDNVRVKVQSLQHKTARFPLKQTSLQNSKQNVELRGRYQYHPASTVTSSEHQIKHMRERIARLCTMSSREGEQVNTKDTPIFTLTFPQIRRKVEPALSAAVSAFQAFRLQHATNNSESQEIGEPSPPKVRKAQTSAEKKVAQGAKGGIEDHSVARGRDDNLTIQHHEPTVRLVRRDMREGPALSLGAKTVDGASSHLRTAPRRPPRPQPSIGCLALGMIQDIWFLVKPVFEPKSDLRRRLQKQRLSWEDVSLIIAAAFFVAGSMLILASAMRLVRAVWGVLRSFGGALGLLAGL